MVAQQELEQLELAHGELDELPAAGELPGDQVDVEIADAEARRLRLAPAAHERTEAGQQLGEGKRLHQIVVGARVEPVHTVLDAVARRDHQHRRAQAAPPQGRQDLDAVPAGQTQVQEDHVERLGIDAIERAFPGSLDDDVVLLVLETLSKRVGHLLLILDDEHAEGRGHRGF